jgi:ferritin-like metal-binding protein YciE
MDIHLGNDRLLTFFVDHLNRIYCSKQHIVAHFPRLAREAHFSDLKNAIMETMQDVENQVARMEEIFSLLNVPISPAKCESLVTLLEETLAEIDIYKDDTALRDMAILFYMHNIESIEAASFRILKITAAQLNNPQITQLLKESFDESKADTTLMLMIASRYITS